MNRRAVSLKRFKPGWQQKKQSMTPLKKLPGNGPNRKHNALLMKKQRVTELNKKHSGWRLEKLPKKRSNAKRWNAKPQKELRVIGLNKGPSVWPLKKPFFCRRSRNKGK